MHSSLHTYTMYFSTAKQSNITIGRWNVWRVVPVRCAEEPAVRRFCPTAVYVGLYLQRLCSVPTASQWAWFMPCRMVTAADRYVNKPERHIHTHLKRLRLSHWWELREPANANLYIACQLTATCISLRIGLVSLQFW